MKKVWNIGKLILAMLLLAQAVRWNQRVRSVSEIISVYMEKEGVAVNKAREICSQEAEREDPCSVCFWKETKDASVSCEETGRSCGVTDITVVGRADLVVPESFSLVWQSEGCFLDTKTAQELFGNTSAAGQCVWYQDRKYQVCGTFESGKKIMIRQAESKNKDSLNRISLKSSDIGSRKEAVSQFLMLYNLSGDEVDLYMPGALIANLQLLCPLALAVSLARRVARNKKRNGRILAAAILIGTLGILWQWITIPPEMIPSRWSDFEFWRNCLKEISSSLQSLFANPLGGVQIDVIFWMLRSTLCSLAAFYLAIISACKISQTCL